MCKQDFASVSLMELSAVSLPTSGSSIFQQVLGAHLKGGEGGREGVDAVLPPPPTPAIIIPQAFHVTTQHVALGGESPADFSVVLVSSGDGAGAFERPPAGAAKSRAH